MAFHYHGMVKTEEYSAIIKVMNNELATEILSQLPFFLNYR
jgi:hypothetical protein